MTKEKNPRPAPALPVNGRENEKLATFAGGCFWCMAPVFKIHGVKTAVVGYAGGESENPTYETVSAGTTGHKEAIQLTYDPDRTAYATLLKIFLQNINPTDSDGQFADRGSQYQTAIFYHDERQKNQAEQALADLDQSGKFDKPLAVRRLPYKNFYPAEDYHQDYYLKSPVSYQAYKDGSGRTDFLARVWNKLI